MVCGGGGGGRGQSSRTTANEVYLWRWRRDVAEGHPPSLVGRCSYWCRIIRYDKPEGILLACFSPLAPVVVGSPRGRVARREVREDSKAFYALILLSSSDAGWNVFPFIGHCRECCLLRGFRWKRSCGQDSAGDVTYLAWFEEE